VDVHATLDTLTRIVEEARAMPLSASCVVNRTEVLDLLDDIRAQLPDELMRASELLDDRGAVLSAATAEAEAIHVAAVQQAAAMVADSEIVKAAEVAAAEVAAAAEADATQRRLEADEYIDARLAQFEIVLQRTLDTVTTGRDRLAVRGGWDDEPLESDPLPEH
jgi:cell division septum initiation protein DivIVA